jgi:hypothetical protein
MARLTRLAAKRLLDNKDADVEVKQRKRSHPVNNKATGPVGAAIEETKSKVWFQFFLFQVFLFVLIYN